MAKVDVEQDTGTATPQSRQSDVVIALAGLADAVQLRSLAGQWEEAGQQITVIYPSAAGLTGTPADDVGPVRLVPREIVSASAVPWLGQPLIYAELLAAAESLGARACVFLNPDLAAFSPGCVNALAQPLVNGECDLTMPLYPAGRFDGLLTQAILAPLTRALYGRRIRYPLAQDFGVSPAFGAMLRQAIAGSPVAAQGLLWPATEAVVRDRKLCQVHLPVHHEFGAGGLDLPSLLQLLVAPLFADAERHASLWQRIRGSQSTPDAGQAFADTAIADDSSPDPRPMVEAFQLGQRNLQEVWSPVLPPVTLLELKKLSRQPLDSFRMPDALWARIIYDFALAYRLRTLARNHLLGSLAPLYLGWVGSRVLEMQTADSVTARQEQLERAFEQNKPYLVQRWRWPDRFNP